MTIHHIQEILAEVNLVNPVQIMYILSVHIMYIILCQYQLVIAGFLQSFAINPMFKLEDWRGMTVSEGGWPPAFVSRPEMQFRSEPWRHHVHGRLQLWPRMRPKQEQTRTFQTRAFAQATSSDPPKQSMRILRRH